MLTRRGRLALARLLIGSDSRNFRNVRTENSNGFEQENRNRAIPKVRGVLPEVVHPGSALRAGASSGRLCADGDAGRGSPWQRNSTGAAATTALGPRSATAGACSRRYPSLASRSQAGVGGTQAYGRAGVLELGGSAGFSAASSYSRFELSPSIGIFAVDNLELSLLTGFSHFRIGPINGSERVSATEIKALIRAESPPSLLGGGVRVCRARRGGELHQRPRRRFRGSATAGC